VEGALRDALEVLYQMPIDTNGASRTDAGVHARGQVAAFTVSERHPPETLFRALNQLTPREMLIERVQVVHDDFHPRHDARGKRYRYLLQTGYSPDPLWSHRAWHTRHSIDVAAMDHAANVLVGTHDFSSFRAAGCQSTTPVKTLNSVHVHEVMPGLVAFDVRGRSFLKYMVRNLVGSLLRVGVGNRDADWLARVLRSCDRTQAAVTAPPWGLVLEEIFYENVEWTSERGTVADVNFDLCR
jgi:tRNA pseudouridine38-40 synthase